MSFLSALMGSGVASSGMFCMWPAINLPLECGLLTVPRDCVRDGDLVEACRTGSCWLAFYRKKLVAGNLESVTFKIHFITLANKKWQTEENWKKMTHSCAHSWEQLWPGIHHGWTGSSAMEWQAWLFRLSNWRLLVEGGDTSFQAAPSIPVVSGVAPLLRVLTNFLTLLDVPTS